MKKYIKPTTDELITTHINVILDLVLTDYTIAAATYKGINVPDGSVLSGIKDAVYEKEELFRWNEFIDSIRDLITDYYEMEIYYENKSEYLSGYFGMLAKDKDGLIVLDFDFTIRVSTHDPKRTDKSESEKKKQKQMLSERIGGAKIKSMRDGIIVNGEIYPSYIKAFVAVDEIIADAHDTMMKNEKYRKRIK